MHNHLGKNRDICRRIVQEVSQKAKSCLVKQQLRVAIRKRRSSRKAHGYKLEKAIFPINLRKYSITRQKQKTIAHFSLRCAIQEFRTQTLSDQYYRQQQLKTIGHIHPTLTDSFSKKRWLDECLKQLNIDLALFNSINNFFIILVDSALAFLNSYPMRLSNRSKAELSHYKNDKTQRVSTKESLPSKKVIPSEQAQLVKKKISKVQLLIKQAQQFLVEPFPKANYLMLSSFLDMTELQQSQLNQQFSKYLSSKRSQLPKMMVEITPQESMSQLQKEEIGDEHNFISWIKPPVQDIARQLSCISNNYLQSCKQLRSIYLKAQQTSRIVQY